MKDSPFSVDASLAATTRHMTTTVDSNVFPPETNKVTSVGLFRRKKYWIVCDGQGHMYGRPLEEPLKMLEQLDKLRKKGVITEEDYQRAKDALLDQL